MITKILHSDKISDNLYLLSERVGPAVVTMALVIGDKKAAVLDAGLGITGTLREHVESLTDKPLIHLITHCDPDHAGGSAQFDDIYMSTLDDDLQKTSLNFEKRVSDLCSLIEQKALKAMIRMYLKKNMTNAESIEYKDINNGNLFDLGGVILEAFSLPGHTKGSMCFVNRAEKYIFSGDTIAVMGAATVGDQRCPPLSVYRDGLQRFLEEGFAEYTIYTGHDLTPLPDKTVSKLLAATDEVLAGKTTDDKPFVSPFAAEGDSQQMMSHTYEDVVVHYNPKNL
jgi:glyoxylase-like metal-dependent hydrolase (beta-lactamase superfamily II)